MAVRSVQLMVNRNEFDAWKTPGGHRRITRASLENWLRAHPEHAKGTALLRAADAAAGRGLHARSNPAGVDGMSTKPVVLLVEDSIHYQNLVRMLIEELFPGVELQTANDGISGMAMFGALKPRVLIVDLMLPGIDGATLISALRTNVAFHAARLIVVTSLTSAEIQKYNFILQGLPVIHKADLVAQLPLELARAMETEAAGVGVL